MDLLLATAENTVAATFEPLTLDEAKRQCEIASGDRTHDVLLQSLIVAARQTWERDTDQVCCTSTWRQRFDSFPPEDYIQLAKRPVASISSLTYVDTNGATQTWSSANYSLDTGRVVPACVLTYDVDWPDARDQRNAITLTYISGHASQSAVPQAWKQAMLLLIRHWFENRSSVNIGNIVTPVDLAYERLVAMHQRPTYP